MIEDGAKHAESKLFFILAYQMVIPISPNDLDVLIENIFDVKKQSDFETFQDSSLLTSVPCEIKREGNYLQKFCLEADYSEETIIRSKN